MGPVMKPQGEEYDGEHSMKKQTEESNSRKVVQVVDTQAPLLSLCGDTVILPYVSTSSSFFHSNYKHLRAK